MSSKSPKFYKDKWFNHYKKIADARGVKFGERQFRRIENGFAFDEWAADNNKYDLGLNTLFQWHYTDAIDSMIHSPSPLLSLMPVDNFMGQVFVQPVEFGKPLKGYRYKGEKWINRSHADLWKKSSN